MNQSINFVNTPFNHEGEDIPDLTRLLVEAADDQIDMSLEVTLNSPFTGVIVVIALSFKLMLVFRRRRLQHEIQLLEAIIWKEFERDEIGTLQ